MTYRRILGGMLGVFLLALAGCAGTTTTPTPSHSPTPGSPVATSGPVAYVLVTQLVRSQPTKQVVAVQGGKPLWSFTLPTGGSAFSLQGETLFIGAHPSWVWKEGVSERPPADVALADHCPD